MLKIQLQEKEMLDFMKVHGYAVDYLHSTPKSTKGFQTIVGENGENVSVSGYTDAYAYGLAEITKWRNEGRKTPKPKPMATGHAYCSVFDQFTRRRGRIIALARLMKKLELTKKFRRFKIANKELNK